MKCACPQYHDLVRDFGPEPRSSEVAGERPEIVCLVGSTKFKVEHEREAKRFTRAGRIVVGMHIFGHFGDLTEEECEVGHPVKDMLDELHLRKIDLADRVFVVNPGGYIGESTRNEIAYARKVGRPIDFLETPK